MKNIAYLRVSKNTQDLDNQKIAIFDYAHKQNIRIDDFIELTVSSTKSNKERGIDSLFTKLESKDRLIVSELSRLGRSVGQIIQIVDQLIKNNILFVAVKENIVLSGRNKDIQTTVMVTMFGLFAEIERDLISERTKQGLAAAKAKGKLIGRPRGTFNSRLDGKEEEIRNLLEKQVSKASIAKIMGISKTAFYSFIKSRNIA